MRRGGVVVLSVDTAAVRFVDDFLAEMMPATEGRAIAVQCARTCVAAVGGADRRRLLIIDGAPPDRTAGVLIEAIRLIDAELPIILVHHGWNRSPIVQDGVRIISGPLARREVQQLLVEILA